MKTSTASNARTRANLTAWMRLALSLSTPLLHGPKPLCCPQCGGQRFTAQAGSAYCFDCGRRWAYEIGGADGEDGEAGGGGR